MFYHFAALSTKVSQKYPISAGLHLSVSQNSGIQKHWFPDERGHIWNLLLWPRFLKKQLAPICSAIAHLRLPTGDKPQAQQFGDLRQAQPCTEIHRNLGLSYRNLVYPAVISLTWPNKLWTLPDPSHFVIILV